MSSHTWPKRPERRESHSVSNGYPDTVKTQGTTTDWLTNYAVSLGRRRPFRPLLTREKALTRDNICAYWKEEWKSSTKCGHPRRIDSKLPAIYKRKLYGSLLRNQAYLLTFPAMRGRQLVDIRRGLPIPRRRPLDVRHPGNSHSYPSGLCRIEINAKGIKEEGWERV